MEFTGRFFVDGEGRTYLVVSEDEREDILIDHLVMPYACNGKTYRIVIEELTKD